jgi:type II secretory pathway component PulK
MMKRQKHNQGSILIFALWTLTLLVIFSVYIGIGVRQRMILVQRLESRSKLYYSAVSGIRKAIMILNQTRPSSGLAFSAQTKAKLMNNEEDFSKIQLNGVNVDLCYAIFDKSFHQNKKQYGMIDEAAKININFADQKTLARLFQAVLGIDIERAEKLGLAMVDWRTSGESSLEGFFSDAYYENLEHPYKSKNASFEILNEVLLVEGMNAEIFERLRGFITIYGNGRININTASFQVLYALGFTPEAAEKIIAMRAGHDDIEATGDDYIFTSEDEFASLLGKTSAVTDSETLFAQKLAQEQQLSVDSDFYSLEVFASMVNEKQQMTVRCVYDASVQAIVYWQET